VITNANTEFPVAYFYLDATPGIYQSTDLMKVWLGWFLSFLGGTMLILTVAIKFRDSKRSKSLV
jgi:hypothetical protein